MDRFGPSLNLFWVPLWIGIVDDFTIVDGNFVILHKARFGTVKFCFYLVRASVLL